jgi:hypothetical protein
MCCRSRRILLRHNDGLLKQPRPPARCVLSSLNTLLLENLPKPLTNTFKCTGLGES